MCTYHRIIDPGHLSAKHNAEAQRRSQHLRREKLKMRPVSQELSAGLLPFTVFSEEGAGISLRGCELTFTIPAWPCSRTGARSTNVQHPFQKPVKMLFIKQLRISKALPLSGWWPHHEEPSVPSSRRAQKTMLLFLFDICGPSASRNTFSFSSSLSSSLTQSFPACLPTAVLSPHHFCCHLSD